jgi:hypothetical protein
LGEGLMGRFLLQAWGRYCRIQGRMLLQAFFYPTGFRPVAVTYFSSMKGFSLCCFSGVLFGMSVLPMRSSDAAPMKLMP